MKELKRGRMTAVVSSGSLEPVKKNEENDALGKSRENSGQPHKDPSRRSGVGGGLVRKRQREACLFTETWHAAGGAEDDFLID